MLRQVIVDLKDAMANAPFDRGLCGICDHVTDLLALGYPDVCLILIIHLGLGLVDSSLVSQMPPSINRVNQTKGRRQATLPVLPMVVKGPIPIGSSDQ